MSQALYCHYCSDAPSSDKCDTTSTTSPACRSCFKQNDGGVLSRGCTYTNYGSDTCTTSGDTTTCYCQTNYCNGADDVTYAMTPQICFAALLLYHLAQL
ncbi:hypothetical protein DPMN_107130 [Dreissena polymorpha]|uniref:Uncharacterized protein n=1 Tax=Dreissena polymorpha TaxID=45954 RepID=A0A9D4K6F7_DREPO|nr:hypothetical protein DPMN_107130 [Dreissena polymorpha]